MHAQPPKITWLIGPVDGSFRGPFPLFAGDLLIHFGTEPLGRNQPTIRDLWQMSQESELWFAHKREDLPPGCQRQPFELGISEDDTGNGEMMDAPNFWRVGTGDRLVLIGERAWLETGMCYLILESHQSALVYWTLEDGRMPMPEEALSACPSPEDALRLGWAQSAVAKLTTMGPAKTMATDGRIKPEKCCH